MSAVNGLAGARPSAHIGWLVAGRAEFEDAVARFFAEGVARGERQMLVVDDPVAAQWPKRLVERGVLVIASIGDTYGAARIVNAATQRQVFAACLARALAEGYTGIRVAGDNSSLVDTPERLHAWLRWEQVADRFMADNPVTGLCAFDKTRLAPDALSMAIGAHRVRRDDGTSS
jgi:hypothetical protein